MFERISKRARRCRYLAPQATGLLLGLGSGFAPNSAAAFRTLEDTPTFHGDGPVVWHANQLELELPDDPNAPLPADEVRAAFKTAAAQWALACSRLRFSERAASVSPMVDD